MIRSSHSKPSPAIWPIDVNMVRLMALLSALGLAARQTLADPTCAPFFFSTLMPDNAIVEKVALVSANGTYGEGYLDLNYP